MIELHNCSWDEFPHRIAGKKFYCFGCGALPEWLSFEVSHYSFAEKIEAFVDNDHTKVGKTVLIDDIEIPIISFSDYANSVTDNTLMLITSMYYAEMIEQMDQDLRLNGLDCYVEVFLRDKTENAIWQDNHHLSEQIPRKLHYCWFGKKKIPEQYQYYLSTWKKYCPDYEIIQWNESNYDINKAEYMRQAYQSEKWAFVSDYARLDLIYQFGGIYLDLDVELLRSPDELLTNLLFFGFEQGNLINTGLGFGAKERLPILKKMRDEYEKVKFIDDNGKMDLTACTKYQTDFLVKLGLKRNGKLQQLGDIMIYPRTMFAPMDFYGVHNHITKQTISIHHYEASWMSGVGTHAAITGKNKEFMKRMDYGKNE